MFRTRTSARLAAITGAAVLAVLAVASPAAAAGPGGREEGLVTDLLAYLAEFLQQLLQLLL